MLFHIVYYHCDNTHPLMSAKRKNGSKASIAAAKRKTRTWRGSTVRNSNLSNFSLTKMLPHDWFNVFGTKFYWLSDFFWMWCFFLKLTPRGWKPSESWLAASSFAALWLALTVRVNQSSGFWKHPEGGNVSLCYFFEKVPALFLNFLNGWRCCVVCCCAHVWCLVGLFLCDLSWIPTQLLG